MSWKDLDNSKVDTEKNAKEAQEAQATIAKNYHHTFSTEQGKFVLNHLVSTFVMDNSTALNAQNINYEAAYKNGEAGVVKQILNQLKRAALI
jgi:hypothetical protein